MVRRPRLAARSDERSAKLSDEALECSRPLLSCEECRRAHDDPVARRIEELQDHAGGFGRLDLIMHEWADRAATARSLELFARDVAPRFPDA